MSLLTSISPVSATTAATAADAITAAVRKKAQSADVDFTQALDQASSTAASSSNGSDIVNKLVDTGTLAASIAALA